MSLKIEMLQEQDVEPTIALFHDIVDELHETSHEIERLQFKNIYPPDKVRERLNDSNCVYLTGKTDSMITCFLFGWATEDIGNVHWLGVKKEYRMNKFGTMLVESAIQEFNKRQCQEARLFTFQRIGLKMFEKCGFNDITYINKHFFGINLIQMVRRLEAFDKEAQTKKIIISGEAGQGIKLITNSLASILNKLGKEVVFNLTYDAGVRGGNITAELIYSNRRIDSPFFKEADIAIQLSKTINPLIRAKKMIVEESIGKIQLKENSDQYKKSDRIPFARISTEHFNSLVFVNMIALGKLLKLIGIEIGQINFKEEFPARFLNENIKAVKYGYSHRDWM
ncbi:MAG: GNAT family N-acetyltransferase [Candidatus Anammoxibacter sp.]